MNRCTINDMPGIARAQRLLAHPIRAASAEPR
jgi:hypothetical protein